MTHNEARVFKDLYEEANAMHGWLMAILQSKHGIEANLINNGLSDYCNLGESYRRLCEAERLIKRGLL